MKLKKRLFVALCLLLLASLACQAVTVNTGVTLSIAQDEPVGVSCGSHTWTEAKDNGLNVPVIEDPENFTGFVYELKDGLIYQYIFRDGIQIDWNTYDANSDGMVQVHGTIPGLLYEGYDARLDFTMYFLVCNGKLFYLDFPKEPINSQNA